MTNFNLSVNRDDFFTILRSGPYYELLIPQCGNFSILFGSIDRRSYMISDAVVENIELIVDMLINSLKLPDGNCTTIRLYDSAQDFVIKHEADNAIVYRCAHIAGINSTYDRVYSVPWDMFEKAVGKISQNYTSFINDSKQQISLFFDYKAPVDSSNGLQLSASIDNRYPLVDSSVIVTAELKNISDKPIELVNYIQPSYSGTDPITFYISGTKYLKSIENKPFFLKPGESYCVSGDIKIDRFEKSIEINYRALNDISKCTTMPISLYLSRFGEHYDISNCWHGELKIEIPIVVLAENWKEKICPAKNFEEWLMKLPFSEHIAL